MSHIRRKEHPSKTKRNAWKRGFNRGRDAAFSGAGCNSPYTIYDDIVERNGWQHGYVSYCKPMRAWFMKGAQ